LNLSEQKFLRDIQVENFISNNNYVGAAEHLFNFQLNSWELLKKNYEALKTVQTKSFWFNGFKIKVQFNKERIISTSAVVDEESINNRKCFLCVNNLPEEQKGILLGNNFLLLCNPYPIFPQHFTISSLKHEPQRISECFEELLELSKLLAPNYMLVYNGPGCGASAPDHLHFQAGTKLFLPIENDIQQLKNDYGKIVEENEKINVSFINDGLRRLILIESTDQLKINNTFKKIFKVHKNLSAVVPEPMINILCNHDEVVGWSVIIFLRSKHRPECFYSQEPERILISPAAIDLGGVLITPREEDFVKIDKELVQNILNEVSLDQKAFLLFGEKLKNEFH
jgi:hypothetical protein